MIRMHIWQRHVAKLITFIAICLLACQLYGADRVRDCPNGKCAQQVQQIVQAPVQVIQAAPIVVERIVSAPVRVIEAVPRIVSHEPVPNVCNCGKQHSQSIMETPPRTNVTVQAPTRRVLVQSVPQVYNTQSFHLNGSGISLAEHLQNTHGVNPSGMSVAEQEAAHKAAHGYGGRSNYRVYNRPKLFGW